MRVSTDPDYLAARADNFAKYEAECGASEKKNEQGAFKEGEYERVLDSHRHDYAISMGRAYLDFVEREAKQAITRAAAG